MIAFENLCVYYIKHTQLHSFGILDKYFIHRPVWVGQ